MKSKYLNMSMFKWLDFIEYLYGISSLYFCYAVCYCIFVVITNHWDISVIKGLDKLLYSLENINLNGDTLYSISLVLGLFFFSVLVALCIAGVSFLFTEHMVNVDSFILILCVFHILIMKSLDSLSIWFLFMAMGVVVVSLLMYLFIYVLFPFGFMKHVG